MKKVISKDVDSYIASSNIESHPILNKLREIIKSTIPEAEEIISYGVPFYKYHGEFVGFAVYKKHVSFGFGAGVIQRKEQETLEKKGYVLGKGTIQIKYNQKVPTLEIKKILKQKAKINEEKNKIK